MAMTAGNGLRFKSALAISSRADPLHQVRLQSPNRSAAAYSTDVPPKNDNDGKQQKTDEPKPKRESLLPTSGPLSPIGISMFLVTAGGILYYFTIKKDQIRKERIENQGKQEVFGRPAIGGPFELTDHHGKPFSNQDLRGKFALIYFGFCHCPDICPDEMDKIGDALAILDRNPLTRDVITPVFITCDPQRDSPEAISEYLPQFHPKFVGLTGSIDQIRTACKAFRVYFSKPPKVAENQDYLVDHSIFSYFMDPNGEFIDVYGKDRTAEYMASDIERRIKQYVDAGNKLEKE
ncbi:Cu-binding protein [Coemansia interrupta]|uniref:Cu-binding protein n=1 Tax=Coemansia interrupta TaxID=1126814 RepID=A0A9W8HIJ2_9FUNG|nr:Cu-binding protein [Coemansia interrupta]